MSVVDQVSQVELNSAKAETSSRLDVAVAILNNKNSTSSAKAKARLDQLSELTELERFQDIVKLKAKLEPEHSGYVAYALYRLQRLRELREFAAKFPSLCTSLSLAQAEYKAGNLDEARTLLDLARVDAEGDDLNDILVNLSAVAALNGDQILNKPLGVYDSQYNQGCSHLTQGRLDEALKEFEKAVAVADDDDDRLSAIVQTGMVYFFQGKHEEAKIRFEQAASELESLPTSLRLVVLNNLAVLNYDGTMESAHEALKAYDDLKRDAGALNGNQRVIIERNYLKLSARVGVSGITRRVNAHAATYPFDLEPAVAALTYTKNPAQIQKLVDEGSEKAKIWMAATKNDQKFVEDKNFEMKMGHYGYLRTALDKAVAWGYDAEQASYFRSFQGPLSRLGLVAVGLRDQKFYQVAEIDQEDINKMHEGIDVEALLAKGIPGKGDKQSQNPQQAEKRKRGGKKHYPKDYDPAAEPDPERWLAKEDRSSHNPKKAKTSQATQGAAGETAEVHTAGAASTRQVVGAKKTKPKKKGRK